QRLMFWNGQFSEEPAEEDMTETLSALVAYLRVPETARKSATSVLERLVDTLRLARHGAMYVIADEDTDISRLSPGAIPAHWQALCPLSGIDNIFFSGDHSRIVATFAGLG